ncbi:MAG: MarR family transcriptional regulator [Methanospirillaceae archaeon]|nr:MarR family transcriptional regulator [Methanospirillaceae archaeon]
MSEGLFILHHISNHGGCLLSEIAVELGIPKSSVSSWVALLCSTGYLQKEGEESSDWVCRKSGMKCACCHCPLIAQENYHDSRVTLSSRGIAFIRRELDLKTRIGRISG